MHGPIIRWENQIFIDYQRKFVTKQSVKYVRYLSKSVQVYVPKNTLSK